MAGRPDGAYTDALKMLARRGLSETQVRHRLARRGYDHAEIDTGVLRLLHEGAIDDRRTAVAYARTETRLKHRGRTRVLRQVEALGISREIAREAVGEVFADLDEALLLERALERRLPSGEPLDDTASFRRLYRQLVTQGFDAEQVAAVLKLCSRQSTHDK